MNINSVSSYSPLSYAKLSVANNKVTEEESIIDDGQKKVEGQKGPRGAGGPEKSGKGKGPKGPDLDIDSDGVWSKDEVEEYAAYSESELNISLDVEEIFSKYDSDEDGSISASERKNLGKDNAFKLSKPQDIMHGMMAGKPMNIPMVNDVEEDEDDENTSAINESIVAQYIEAYQSNSNYKLEDVSSLFDAVL